MAMYHHFSLRLLTVSFCLSLCFWAGCSLSGKRGSDDNNGPGDGGSVSGDMIGFSSNAELEAYLKSQYLRSVYTDYPVALETRTASEANLLDDAGNATESTPDAFSPENPDGYTGTNLQEAGVDESDLVKTDGEYFYIASNDTLNIVRAADPLEIVGRIALEETIDSLYLYDDLLIVLYSPSGYGGSRWIDPGMPGITEIGIPYWIPI
jgi:uncharacterized secreted protein with C-terminal beta-propeller domain